MAIFFKYFISTIRDRLNQKHEKTAKLNLAEASKMHNKKSFKRSLTTCPYK